MIDNKEVMKALNLKTSTFYAMKKRSPRLIELVQKGLEYEKLEALTKGLAVAQNKD